MKTLKQLSVLGVTTALAVTLAVLLEFKATPLQEQPAALSAPHALIFPNLFSKLNDVAAITLTHQGTALSLTLTPAGWLISSEFNYPASFEKVKKFLWDIADLEVMAIKTKNPELLGELGLLDVKEKEGVATQIELKDAKGDVLASLVTGKTQKSPLNPQQSAVYVRKAEDHQAYLVNALSMEKQGLDWAERLLWPIDEKRYQSITIQKGKDTLTLTRNKPEDQNFELLNLTKDEKIASHFTVNNMVSTFSRLTFEHVKPVRELERAESIFKITARTFDGLSLEAEGFKLPVENTWIKLTATIEEPNKEIPIAFPLKSLEDVKKEAGALMKRHEGWIYQVPNYQTEDLQKTQKDLTQKM